MSKASWGNTSCTTPPHSRSHNTCNKGCVMLWSRVSQNSSIYVRDKSCLNFDSWFCIGVSFYDMRVVSTCVYWRFLVVELWPSWQVLGSCHGQQHIDLLKHKFLTSLKPPCCLKCHTYCKEDKDSQKAVHSGESATFAMPLISSGDTFEGE